MANLFLILSVLAVIPPQAIFAQSPDQRVTLYRHTNCHGPGLSFQNQYVAHLGDSGWNDATYSVKLTGGWLFYDHSDYNTGNNALTEVFFGPNQNCYNLNTLQRRLTSVRFAGDKSDYRINSLTLYQEENFQDLEEYTTGDLANVNLKQHKSLIITGTSEWTLYDQASYNGNAVCIKLKSTTKHGPYYYFVSHIDIILNVPINSVRSIKLGCHSNKSV